MRSPQRITPQNNDNVVVVQPCTSPITSPAHNDTNVIVIGSFSNEQQQHESDVVVSPRNRPYTSAMPHTVVAHINANNGPCSDPHAVPQRCDAVVITGQPTEPHTVPNANEEQGNVDDNIVVDTFSGPPTSSPQHDAPYTRTVPVAIPAQFNNNNVVVGDCPGPLAQEFDNNNFVIPSAVLCSIAGQCNLNSVLIGPCTVPIAIPALLNNGVSVVGSSHSCLAQKYDSHLSGPHPNLGRLNRNVIVDGPCNGPYPNHAQHGTDSVLVGPCTLPQAIPGQYDDVVVVSPYTGPHAILAYHSNNINVVCPKTMPDTIPARYNNVAVVMGECKGFGQIWLYSLFLHFLLLFYFRKFQYFAYISLTTCPNAVILVQPQSPILSAHYIFLSVT